MFSARNQVMTLMPINSSPNEPLSSKVFDHWTPFLSLGEGGGFFFACVFVLVSAFLLFREGIEWEKRQGGFVYFISSIFFSNHLLISYPSVVIIIIVVVVLLYYNLCVCA